MIAKKNLTYDLILNQKPFEIPSGFRFLHDADPFICAELIKNKKYIVKSHVNENVFQSFINFWIYRDTPIFNQENISQYAELIQEFDLMKDLIEMYKNLDSINEDLSHQNQLYKTAIGNDEKEIKEKEAKSKELFQFLFNLKKDINCMLNEKEEFSLILNDVKYTIPADFRYLNDVDPEIYNILKENKKYIVKSNATFDIFESFIDYWILKSIPNFNDDNISEFEELSNEFDLMKDLITIYKNKKNEIISLQNNFNEKSKNYNEIIAKLCEKHIFDEKEAFFNFKKELLNECQSGYVKNVGVLLQKKVYQNGLIFSLDENTKNAAVIRCHDAEGDIIIPYSILDSDQEYVVTKIMSKLFDSQSKVNSIQFDDNSAIIEIDEYAFGSSNITKIILPSHLTKINPYTFCNCKLKSIEFTENSELKIIDQFAFDGSGLESIVIPQYVTELVEGWCCNTEFLVNGLVDERNECFKYIDDSIIIGKSNNNNENYDILCFARRDIEHIIIPSFIKRISSYTFYDCKSLKTIEFQENSELETIGEYSFSNTND